ncbi:radical SAM protein [Thermosulfurimonas marina]|uniref:FeMo cofactor biosynthesis protein NifB n=1 Tax=Thermosulfurimonas marina TaxID=2047767 RepID=A0A6H1WS60_9BACT|nr:radical SAM protein [Thermosulfurimonas marina]QJA06055.1 radical SAM protein [Thermosulfurimonas marina]
MIRHPCFDETAHRTVGRLHLPVAPRCNVQCAYCDRRYPCVSENRPGTARRVIPPEEAPDYVEMALTLEPRIEVIGVAGPGDPLANEETFRALSRVREAFPRLKFCVSTNGLLLKEKLPDLVSLGVQFLTVTVNAATLETASKFYLWVRYQGKKLTGKEAAEAILSCQMEGLREAAKAGIRIKVNTVLVPGINDAEVGEIARRVWETGAHLMNIIPLIPLGRFRDRRPPTEAELRWARRLASRFMPQFLSCRRCRADAAGVPGEGDSLQTILWAAAIS